MQEYTVDGLENEANKYTHLTNAAVQKYHPDYELYKEDTIWDMK